jgi:putative nucleotidyltransferase with HDIG domain
MLFKKGIKDFFTRGKTQSVGIFALFLILSFTAIFVNPQFYQKKIKAGEIALKNIYAPYDFSYSWEIDGEKTKQLQDAAYGSVPFYIERYSLVSDNLKTMLGSFFDSVIEESARESVSIEEKIANIRKNSGIELDTKDIRLFLDQPDKEKIRRETLQVAKNVLHAGYISDEGLDTLVKEQVGKVEISDKASGSEIERAPKELISDRNIRSSVDSYAGDYFGQNARLKQAVADLIMTQMKPNLQLDQKKTMGEREAALKNVSPVYQTWHVKKNELIIERGRRINERELIQLAELRSFFTKDRSGMFFLAAILLFILLGTIGGIHMRIMRRAHFLNNAKELAIVLLNIFLMIVIADFIIRMPQPSFFIPLESMAMMIMLLVGFNQAFLASVLTGILIATLSGGKTEIAVALIAASAVGIYAVRDARRRSSILWAGLAAGGVKFVAIIYAGIVTGTEPEVFFQEGLWGVFSGVMSGILVMGFLPVFESIFKVPTNISLLELSDLNHPLLKRLSCEAPGTYHHSIMVGNLAEAACDSIGANSLLARVGAYYHDIGKMTKPHYYSENEMGERSKHQNLTPSMSTLVIGKHVKEGVEMAEKHKLSGTITDLIRQHHGTSLISYFYQKALEKADEDTVLNEDSFRYPGPKPQTKEAAILMLADSAEAASRALSAPTPASIKTSVQKIINNKFIDGQLDECDLTLKDMHKISESFVRVLTAVFHTRVDYPNNKEEPARS